MFFWQFPLLYYCNSTIFYRLIVDNYIQTYQQSNKSYQQLHNRTTQKTKKFPLYRKNTLKHTLLVILHNSHTMFLCRCYKDKESYKKGFTRLRKNTIIQLPQGRKPKRHGEPCILQEVGENMKNSELYNWLKDAEKYL